MGPKLSSEHADCAEECLLITVFQVYDENEQ